MCAIAVFAGTKMYLRPGEMIGAAVLDLGLPIVCTQKGLEFHTLTIAPYDGGRSSKTQTFDDTVVVDEPVWLGPVLEHISRGKPADSPLFQLTMPEFQSQWAQACKLLGIKAHPDQIRHSGASSDTLSKRRTARQVGARGRWSTLKSQQRYSKGGALQKAWKRVPLETRQWCTLQSQHIQSILSTGRVVGPPPVVRTAVNLVQ